VGITDFVRFTGIEKDTFGSRRFTCVDMRHDTKVSGMQ
jgi:hypothetical protein